MQNKYEYNKNEGNLIVPLKTFLLKMGLQANNLNEIHEFRDLLLYPYYEGSEHKLKLSKIDLFFYSYPFRVLYAFFMFFFLIFFEQPLYIKLPLTASIFGCILQGLGGACTLAVAVWIAYNLSRAVIG